MTPVEKIERLMLRRESGWWEKLCETIPALTALTDTPQPPEYHAEGDVAIHTRLAIEACPKDCDPDLLWVALLHDVGKPATTQQNEQGRITAYGHAELGAKITGRILSNLEMPVQRCERIIWAIRHHTFHHSWQLQKSDVPSKKQHRYLTDPKFPLLLEFLRIDSLASQGNPAGMETYDFYKELWESISQQRAQSNS
ncbi:MAG: HD domain-containing protein [Desulfuromonadales bacterium]|nr:HD domain-containing protein [Desulfuromonadales bacterium]